MKQNSIVPAFLATAFACACFGFIITKALIGVHVKDASDSAEPFRHTSESFNAEWEQAGDLEEGLQPHAANGLPNPNLYPPVPINKLCVEHGWARPRALIEGKVTMSKSENDGDSHFVVEDSDGNHIVCEVIPELPYVSPKVGMTVYVWGIPRWDGQHRWQEIHPVIGWKEKPN